LPLGNTNQPAFAAVNCDPSHTVCHGGAGFGGQSAIDDGITGGEGFGGSGSCTGTSCSSQGGTGSGSHIVGSNGGTGGGCGFHLTTDLATGQTIERGGCGGSLPP
jgi:hypothetical protein